MELRHIRYISGKVSGLISKHHFLKFEEEDDNPTKLPVSCAICGQSPRISALSWVRIVLCHLNSMELLFGQLG